MASSADTTTKLYAQRASLKQRETEANDELWEQLVNERLEIEDKILAAPITNIGDVGVKVETAV